MHTVDFLSSVVEHHQILTYALIYLGLILEGEVVILSTGLLAHLGAVNLPLALVFILLGAISKTFLGYALGGYLKRRFNDNKFLQYMRLRVKFLLPRLRKDPFWSIFASKFLIGANNLVVLFCGYEKINYKKFLKAEALAIIIWAPLLLLLGYLFSHTALAISAEIWKFLAVIIVLFTMFILFDKFVSWLYEVLEEMYDEIKQ